MIETIPYCFFEKVGQSSPNRVREESQESNPEDHDGAIDSRKGADKNPWGGLSVIAVILGLLYSMLHR